MVALAIFESIMHITSKQNILREIMGSTYRDPRVQKDTCREAGADKIYNTFVQKQLAEQKHNGLIERRLDR